MHNRQEVKYDLYPNMQKEIDLLLDPEELLAPDPQTGKVIISYSFDFKTFYKRYRFLADGFLETPEYTSEFGQLSAKAQGVVRQVFERWPQFANVQFVEQKDPMFYILKFTNTSAPHFGDVSTDMTPGFTTGAEFAKKAIRIMALNGPALHYLTKINARPKIMHALFHESSHMLGLRHVFENLPPLTDQSKLEDLYYSTTSFSVMNYYHIEKNGYEMVRTTPSAADLEALASVYRKPIHNEDNTVYDLTQYIDGNEHYKSLQTLPHDSGGYDVVIAKGTNIFLNLYPFSLSEIDGNQIQCPNILLEGAIIDATGEVSISLNDQSNKVVIKGHTFANVHVDALYCGHAIIFGLKDYKINLQGVEETQNTGFFNATAGSMTLHNETFSWKSSITLYFDRANSLTLVNADIKTMATRIFEDETVPQSVIEWNRSLIKARKKHLEENKSYTEYLSDAFSNFPTTFIHDFKRASLQGSVIEFLTLLTRDALKKYGCSEKQIAIVTLVMECTLIFYTGSTISVLGGTLARIALERLDFKKTATNAGGYLMSFGLNWLLGEAPLLPHAAYSAANFAGQWIGREITNKVYNNVSSFWSKGRTAQQLSKVLAPPTQELCPSARATIKPMK